MRLFFFKFQSGDRVEARFKPDANLELATVDKVKGRKVWVIFDNDSDKQVFEIEDVNSVKPFTVTNSLIG